MSGQWRITVRREEREFPFDHLYHLAPPEDCDCGWVCRTLPAAMKIVDAFVWLQRHPEIDGTFDSPAYRKHLDHMAPSPVLGERNNP